MAKALASAAGMLVAAVAGCSSFDGPYNCETNEQCNAVAGGGICQPDKLCSYADTDCTSGQRYGETAGDKQGVCVGETTTELACFGAGIVKPCFPEPPAGDVDLTAAIDTGSSPLCSTVVTSADGFCVIAGARILVGTTIAVTGPKPLVLVATSTIEIGGVLDTASHHSTGGPPFTTTQIGPGADPAACGGPGTPPTEGGGSAGGGGAGGTFVVVGGGGGAAPNGSVGGMPTQMQPATTLRGGCPGQGGVHGVPGTGGHGGGAVYLIASTAITISGRINASGEGGIPGLSGGGGGGGGGSGGMIGLDAPTITNMGAVFANGGSGGEGGGQALRGSLGPEPTGVDASGTTSDATPNGGEGGGGGAGGTGNGGPNGGAGNPGTVFQSLPGGGGGGGGGTGVIKVYRGTLGGAHSPLPAP